MNSELFRRWRRVIHIAPVLKNSNISDWSGGAELRYGDPISVSANVQPAKDAAVRHEYGGGVRFMYYAFVGKTCGVSLKDGVYLFANPDEDPTPDYEVVEIERWHGYYKLRLEAAHNSPRRADGCSY